MIQSKSDRWAIGEIEPLSGEYAVRVVSPRHIYPKAAGFVAIPREWIDNRKMVALLIREARTAEILRRKNSPLPQWA